VVESLPRSTHRHHGIPYKWIALSNTTLGVLMASINGTILIISLPAIFRGIHINPLAPGQTGLLLWILLGFNVATTILLVSFGRISDTYGRVRLYNLGFAIFTFGSLLLFFTPSSGIAGEWELTVFRFVQGIGGAFLFANSAAILTDAFPANERGLALGLNQIAGIGGGIIGLVVGGLLASIDWRLIFLVSVPVGLAGTVWAYIALRELATTRESKRIDWWGNLTFALGLLGVLIGLTYAIMPYGHDVTGWSNPLVIWSLVVGVALLIAFLFIERAVPDPMFHLDLFRNRAFAAGNVSGLLAAIARGGLQFMIIIWLQGIWLPLHGVSFANTPLDAGIDTLPQMVGFLLAGPISGRLSDRYGARWFATIGMLVSAAGFFLLNTLPADFSYWTFATYIFLIGVGMGLFASPNTASIMSAVPARYRGVASGMRATFMNAGQMLSMGIFFTIVISTLAGHLPGAMTAGLSHYGLPAPLVHGLAHLPPMAVLFAALLGYNPLAKLVPAQVFHLLPAFVSRTLLSPRFFPGLIAAPFMKSLAVVFIFAAAMSVVAAFASLLRGARYVYDDEAEAASTAPAPTRRITTDLLWMATLAAWLNRDGADPAASREQRERLERALRLLQTVLAAESAKAPAASGVRSGVGGSGEG
jgi:MFS family permease